MRKGYDVMTRSRVPALLAALACAGLAGCGGDKMPKTYPLEGKVVFKGGAPLTGGSIAFESATGDPPWRAGAAIDESGNFSDVVTLRSDGKEAGGLVEGEHRVKIDLGRGGEDRPRVRVPARYLDFSKSRLTVRVPAPDNRVVIELDPR
jgi:hypothetical protein